MSKEFEGSDYFVDEKWGTKWQPKKDVADYVESEGFRVPKRYETVQAGIDDVGEVLVRSEHPQDYNGVSGVHDSFKISEQIVRDCQARISKRIAGESMKPVPGLIEIYGYDPSKKHKQGYSDYAAFARASALEKSLGEQEELYLNNYATWQRLTKMRRGSVDSYREHFSLSVWEQIKGLPFIMVRDSAFADGTHLMIANQESPYTKDSKYKGQYFRTKGNEITADSASGNERTEKLRVFSGKEPLKLAKWFQEIIGLEKFDGQHCPIVEGIMGEDGEIYFLQYLRTNHSVQEPQHVLTSKGENVHWVNGATPKGGTEFKVNLRHPQHGSRWEKGIDPWVDSPAFDLHHTTAYSDFAAPFRPLSIEFYGRSPYGQLAGIIQNNGHDSIGELLKTPLGIIPKHEEWTRPEIGPPLEIASKRAYEDEVPKATYARVWIESDGDTAEIECRGIIKED